MTPPKISHGQRPRPWAPPIHMPRFFFWQNICRGTFGSMRLHAASRWEFLKLVLSKLTGQAVWRYDPFGTIDESNLIAEVDMSDGLLEALAGVQATLQQFNLRLVCCIDYAAVHHAYSGQSANFVSGDGLLGVAVFWWACLGTSATRFSCTTKLTNGQYLCTLSGRQQDRGGAQGPPDTAYFYSNCRALEPLLVAHRGRLAHQSALPWSDGEVKQVVVDLWNRALLHKEQLGTIFEMSIRDVARVQQELDNWCDRNDTV